MMTLLGLKSGVTGNDFLQVVFTFQSLEPITREIQDPFSVMIKTDLEVGVKGQI